MAGYFILSTRKGDYRALAVQGSQVYACHAQLVALLRAHLGEPHARLLAEPLMDQQGNAVDWYAAEAVRPLAGLPPEAQENALAHLRGLITDIEALAARLGEESDPNRRLCGAMLHLATRYPGPGNVYVDGAGQPVLTCWGMTLAASAAPESLVRPGAAPLAAGASNEGDRIIREGKALPRSTAPLPPPAPISGAGEPWWKKLLMILLGLALAFLLFWGLGRFFPGLAFPLPGGCVKEAPLPAEADTAPAPLDPAPTDAELTALRAELEVLRQAARTRAEACIPPAPPVAEVPKAPEVTEPPKDLGDLLGDLTDLPKEEPKPEPPKETPKPEPKKPEPKKESPKKGDPLKLPDKDDKSMDFLDGCWNCRTGLTDTRGNPIKVRFCFGKNGKGQITILDRRGNTFTGTAQAQMQNGKLHIDAGEASSRTSRGSFNGVRIDCTPGAGNAALCYGRNKTDNSPWKATFLRD